MRWLESDCELSHLISISLLNFGTNKKFHIEIEWLHCNYMIPTITLIILSHEYPEDYLYTPRLTRPCLSRLLSYMGPAMHHWIIKRNFFQTLLWNFYYNEYNENIFLILYFFTIIIGCVKKTSAEIRNKHMLVFQHNDFSKDNFPSEELKSN